MEKNTKEAFKWIVGLLQKHKIPFQISGGFAAKLYGSERELSDIDIGVPDNALGTLISDVKEYITLGPEHFVDNRYDLQIMCLRYKGQEIDLVGRTSIKLFNKKTNTWVPGHRDISKSEMKKVYGLTVPIIPKRALIAYKKILMRKIDLIDIKALEERS